MNPNMVNFILEHGNEKDKICSICCDDKNLISKDNVLVLTCCHAFHLECGIKALENAEMACPLCRNVQDFSWGKNGVYFPVIEFVIDRKMCVFLYNFITFGTDELADNTYILQHSILTENIDILMYLNRIENFETHIFASNFILENKKYKVLEYYAKRGDIFINDLLWHAIMKADMFAIMYLIYEFKADVYNKIDGLSMFNYAIKSGSFEIVSYFIHDLRMDILTYDFRMDVLYDNSVIKTALEENNYDITKLCIENLADPEHPDNAQVKSILEYEVNHVRALIVEYGIRRMGAKSFSKFILRFSIKDCTTMKLFESFLPRNGDVGDVDIVVVGNVDDGDLSDDEDF